MKDAGGKDGIGSPFCQRFNHVFFTSSGSEANDTNLRLVHRYFDLIGKPELPPRYWSREILRSRSKLNRSPDLR